MAHILLIAGLSLVAAAQTMDLNPTPVSMAPEAPPGARYCMYVGPVTGSQVETIQCWTREQWAEQGVDVDKEWAKEGVRVVS